MVANPLKGEVEFPPVDVVGFEQGGILVLDFNALCTLEGVLGEKIEEIGGAALQSPQMMRTVMRVAMFEHHGDVDDRTVGKVIQGIGVDNAAALTNKAFELSFPEAAKAGGNPPQSPPKGSAAGTGNGASERGAKSASKPARSTGKPRGSSR